MPHEDYARQHGEIMAGIHALLEELSEALDAREQRIEGRVTAEDVTRIAAVRDRLRSVLDEVAEE